MDLSSDFDVEEIRFSFDEKVSDYANELPANVSELELHSWYRCFVLESKLYSHTRK